jgi:hypothetical protein
MLIRRGWLLALGGVVGIAAGWAISGISVSASSAFQVNAAGNEQFQSHRLALTYARLLPEDSNVLAAMSRRTHLSTSYIRSHLSMEAGATNVVVTRFSADDAQTAIRALHALSAAFRTATDGAGTSLRKTTALVSKPKTSGGFSRKYAVVFGGLSGLLIALSLCLGLERRTPRVDTLRDLANVLPVPVSRASERTFQGALDALTNGSGLKPIEFISVGSHRPWSAVARKSAEGTRAGAQHGPVAYALVVERGAPAVEVEEAWRTSVASRFSVLTALLVDPKPLLRRPHRPLNGPAAS